MRSIERYLSMLLLALLIGGCSAMPKPAASPSAAEGKSADKVDSKLQKSYELALIAMQRGDTKRAKAELQALADAHPDLSGPLTNLAILQMKEKDYKTAEQSLRSAIRINPKNAPAHNQLGLLLRMQGRFDEAEQAYRKAVEIEPVYLLAHRNLGILYDLYLAKPEMALEQYRICQKLADTPDQEIAGWILDLERQVKHAKQPRSKTP